MVCVPCIVIPVLLWIWHRFLQPIVLKFYNPWAKVETTPVPTDSDTKSEAKCPFAKTKEVTADSPHATTATGDKKTD
ncbi:UPF0729 protein CG18508 [Eurytemora carolleeae]|uniref:UPF0729 protein CG18508 n=1 Tax=Eurytemora carolleeae TaxID=1294199 RepID=UPI000C78DA41|nr:UPF0729 protein CG18508 [Eurytemora carolleeae]|eukprot:XP_023331591.1 UPF0729 protein CG18508-like [Eurytemora affinis]